MPLRETLWQWSGAMQRRVIPDVVYSQTVFEDRLRRCLLSASAWLDLGCGHRLLPEWREDAEVELMRTAPFTVGLDADYDALASHRSFSNRCLGDITKLPFSNEGFDLVTANMVVEHLDDPAHQFAEVARVLAPGGRFVFHTPNAASYVVALSRFFPDTAKQWLAELLEARAAADVYPTHYRANRKATIEKLAAGSGLVVESVEFVSTSPAFSMIPPLLMLELLFIRQLQRRPALAKYRPTLICTLRKRS